MMYGSYAYAGKILRLNLSSGQISNLPTGDYASRFIGGHWPAQLKVARYDALVVEGASEKPVIP